MVIAQTKTQKTGNTEGRAGEIFLLLFYSVNSVKGKKLMTLIWDLESVKSGYMVIMNNSKISQA